MLFLRNRVEVHLEKVIDFFLGPSMLYQRPEERFLKIHPIFDCAWGKLTRRVR
jgi:hypothetical protein